MALRADGPRPPSGGGAAPVGGPYPLGCGPENGYILLRGHHLPNVRRGFEALFEGGYGRGSDGRMGTRSEGLGEQANSGWLIQEIGLVVDNLWKSCGKL